MNKTNSQRFELTRTASGVLALTIAGMCCVATAYALHFYYLRYEATVTRWESSINSFEMRLARLEAHKARELRPVHVWGRIATTDRPIDEALLFYQSAEKRAEGVFELINAKGGPVIRPELRLSFGSVTNHEYSIEVSGQFGKVADAWVSHAAPFQNLAAFEEFHLYCANETNVVKLIVRLKPNASIEMRFRIVVLCVD